MNDGFITEKAEQTYADAAPRAYVMVVHENITIDTEDPTTPQPPSEPPPPKLVHEPLPPKPPNPTFESTIISKWNDLMGRSNHASRTRSSILDLSEEQRKDDLDTIRKINSIMFIRLQCNGGANISVTTNLAILQNIKRIEDHHIGGIGKGIKCTHRGMG